ncbi:hypothetical protein [Yeguia hominis]|uniref:Uncharacterized protein n=1 Tax=Yeguia hominis TaxID=2763662 RepID=A0A926D6V3_9FIRM|nr:hypothetical protein [Yeguia hominis]MBC8533500.1 hypothetical protein [Yeguia hominis]
MSRGDTKAEAPATESCRWNRTCPFAGLGASGAGGCVGSAACCAQLSSAAAPAAARWV